MNVRTGDHTSYFSTGVAVVVESTVASNQQIRYVHRAIWLETICS